MKTRHIEMYVGTGGDFGTWFTDYIEIPADTPDDKIETVAKDVARTEFACDNFVFCGVYSIPELDDDINDDDKDYLD